MNNTAAIFNPYKIIKVKPSQADPEVSYWDSAHVVYYDQAIQNNKLLLWLTGTNGSTNNVPAEFFKTAISQGYKVIALSFISVPGVSQVCIGNMLQTDVNCAAAFRRKRIYGDNDFTAIPDKPRDAIIPRLVKLLHYLAITDTAGHWTQYMDQQTGKPAWNRIAIAGQSQGGGMAQFIGQHEQAYRIISFSGGWDYSDSKNKKIAGWYYQKSVTPLENQYATYHVKEIAATQLEEICTALQIPAGNLFALNEPLINKRADSTQSNNKNPTGNTANTSGGSRTAGNNPYHGEGIRNPVYRPAWIKMLGNGF